jgi:hypothetical protein
MHRQFLCAAVFACRTAVASTKDGQDERDWTAVAADGRILYARDEMGNRLPDFSKCGFKGGLAAIPNATVKATVRPGNTDDRAAIQEAIDRVSNLPPDERGIRGAVMLEAGVYRLSGGVRLSQSGVILQGAGKSEGGTVLRATARRKYTLITMAGAESSPQARGSVSKISDSYVPVGSHRVTLDSVSGLVAGDAVMVRRPSTRDWIKTLGMDQLTNPWKEGDRDCVWERVITGIDGRTVFLNAPITTAIESRFGGGTLWKYQWPERINNCGVENIRGVSDTDGTTDDENHGWNFIEVQRATDCWVRNVTAEHFGYACVAITGNARSISVLDSECIDPVSQVAGGRRYGFYVDDSQLCLVQGCRNRNDRHQFVTGSNTCGPNAFVDGVSESAKSDAGPHHRWANGILWDSIVLKGGDLNARNRMNSGSGHGWAGANCVFWNCRAEGFIVENPPTARNWCIGGIGTIRESRSMMNIGSQGTFSSHGTPVRPASLFAAQRRDAVRDKGVRVCESFVGKFDGTAGAEELPVEADWKSKAAARGMVPWTHNFGISKGEKIVSASLSISVRRKNGSGEAVAGFVCFGDIRRTRPFSDAGLTTEWPSSTVLCFDLKEELATIGLGTLDVAIANGFTIDWAVLDLAVAGATDATDSDRR